jgi:hAT family C-terminal dimerisation region
MGTHMSKCHQLTAASKPPPKEGGDGAHVAKPRQLTLAEATRSAPRDVENALHGFVAATGQPFTLVENEAFRSFVQACMQHGFAAASEGNKCPKSVPGSLCRKYFRTKHLAKANENFAVALECFKSGTLAIDTGTVVHRYLVAVLCSPTTPPLLCGFIDVGAIGGSFTAANVTKYLTTLLSTTLKTVRISAIVADNASNLQAALRAIRIDNQSGTPFAGVLEIPGDGAEGEEEEAEEAEEAEDAAETDEAEEGAEEEETEEDEAEEEEEEGGGTKRRNETEEQEEEQFDVFDPLQFTATSVIPQRCMVHSLQLVVRDIVTALLSTLEGEVLAVQARRGDRFNNQPVKTRWNSTYLMFVECAKLLETGAYVDAALKSKLGTAIAYLGPFYKATLITEGDRATMWDGIAALAHIIEQFEKDHSADARKILAILEKRCEKLVSVPMMMVLYLHPATPRYDLPQAHAEFLLRLHTTLLPPASAGAAIDYKRAPWMQGVATLSQFKSFWNAVDDENSRSFASRMLSVTPSEASVERVFSMLGRYVTKNRTRLTPTAVAAALQFASARMFLKDGVPVDNDDDDVLGVNAAMLTRLLSWGLRNNVSYRRPSIIDLRMCGECKKTQTQHEVKDMVCCAKCAQWFVRSCVQVGAEDFLLHSQLNGPVFECRGPNTSPRCKALPSGFKDPQYLKWDAEYKRETPARRPRS